MCPVGLVRAFGHILVLYCFVGDTHEAYAFIAKILSDPAVRPERCVSTTVESVPRKATARFAECVGVATEAKNRRAKVLSHPHSLC